MAKRRTQVMDGNTAAAYASYAFTEVAAIFPITPSSPMAEHIDEWSANGRKNIFGQTVLVKEMQSEGGAAGALHGSLQGGALTSTYTASQGLLLMIPNMYKIAGELLPAVFHVSARSLANNSLSIFGDHQDVMGTRQTGFCLLASSSVQQCMDLAAVAHLSAIKSRLPFLHFFDGFRTSHEMQSIDVLEYDELAKIVDWDAIKAFRDRALNPDHPELRGVTQNPDIFWQQSEAVNKFYIPLPGIVEEYMNKISALTGRDYKLYNYYGSPTAENIIIAMGSSCDAIRETLEYVNKNGQNLGLLEIHLYRPFVIDKFLEAIPKTVKRICVLDRTKEPATVNPLALDVRNAFYGKPNAPMIVSGRYGISSKEFNPQHIMGVYENLASATPKDDFTIGIVDDVTNTSIEPSKTPIDPTPAGTTACKFWGFGSDGTVSANKAAIKIIGDHTDMYSQAYFAYDSKKSGGLTISHLRFGNSPIQASYYVRNTDFIACHNQAYVNTYPLLDGIKKGGTFLLNCIWSPEELDKELPGSLKRAIANNDVQFYTMNAVKIADDIGLSGRINMIMQAAFFKLSKVIPLDDAIKYLKESVEESYGKQGQAVIDANNKAIDIGTTAMVKIDVPASWKTAELEKIEYDPEMPWFVKNVLKPMSRQQGDDLPVSVFNNGHEDGTFPTSSTQWEKRGISLVVPYWDSTKCIQCNQCAFVCPHAVLRPLLLTEEEVKAAPAGYVTKDAAGFPGYKYHMAISALDCTGCGSCANVCPAKEKALVMKPIADGKAKFVAEWDYDKNIQPKPLTDAQRATVKGSQFLRPLLEFSGACAGCGETPYAKLVTQLFGDRMVTSDSAGCSTVWGGSPEVSYTKNARGHGPAWGFSLFEDNGEYGYGMMMGAKVVRNGLRASIESLAGKQSGELKAAMQDWLDNYAVGDGTRERSDRLIAALEANKNADPAFAKILERKDYLVKRSNWIIGGDGWAYDIGYGGLDHVLAQGDDINVLVLDTEVYSNTGGQSSKATPTAAIAQFAASGKKTCKKDLGVMAMSYGYVYVAQIAMGADKNQTLKAILEAEAYPGPSLIIAYAPCINHGIKGGMGIAQDHMKKAVEAGYWSLYRYNPLLKAQGKNPFTLDSKEPTADFKEFLMSEVRYASLFRAFPDHAQALIDKATEDAMARIENYKRLASNNC